ncbi:MAG: hypothetical protein LBU17_01710, partial [Treponema sp.]|nr:hypothetical protein [Treponema sp.]
MANITLKINSKHDDSGVKDAQKSLNNIGDTVNKINGIVKGFLGLAVFKELIAIIKDCTKAYEDNLTEISKQTGEFTVYQQKMADFKKTTDSIKSSIGEIFGNIKVEALSRLQEPFDKIKTWLDDNKDTIVGFFFGLPEIAKRTFQLIQDMLSFVFSMDFWGKYGKNVGNILVTAFKGVFETLWSIIKAIGTTIWEPLKTGFLIVGDGIQDTWYKITEFVGELLTSIVNFFISGINKAIGLINALIDNPLTQAIFGQEATSGAKLEEITVLVRTPGQNPAEGRASRSINGDAIFDAWKNVTSTFSESIDALVESAKENGASLAEAFDPLISAFTQDIEDIIKAHSGVASGNRGIAVKIPTDLNDVFAKVSSEFDTVSKNISSILSGVTTKTGNALKEQISFIDSLAAQSKKHISDYLSLMQAATNPKDALHYYNRINQELKNMNDLAGKLKSKIAQANVEAAKQTIKNKATGASEVADVVQGFAQGGIFGAIAVIIGKIVELFSTIENLGKVLNPFTTIIERIKDILEPLLNELFAPFVIILETLGDIIGNILAPVFTTLMA